MQNPTLSQLRWWSFFCNSVIWERTEKHTGTTDWSIDLNLSNGECFAVMAQPTIWALDCTTEINAHNAELIFYQFCLGGEDPATILYISLTEKQKVNTIAAMLLYLEWKCCHMTLAKAQNTHTLSKVPNCIVVSWTVQILFEKYILTLCQRGP